ncbi:hypothetical protein MNBD_BACTEROID01-2291 [hydrothermal vent metagenome]|uniref:Uncharacterized protein n=1 Tax=hydrothermal vent metagenome TaxID=652676 RepID=A0A3B0TSN2_9ZZZZ
MAKQVVWTITARSKGKIFLSIGLNGMEIRNIARKYLEL